MRVLAAGMGRNLVAAVWAACALFGFVGLAAGADDFQLCNDSVKDPDQGIPACTRIIESGQNTALEAVYNNRGNAWFQLRNMPNAIDDYSSAIQRNPRFADALRNRAFVLINTNQFDRAIVDLGQAISLDAKSSYAFYLRGFALLNIGEFESAIKNFDQALALKKDYFAAYLHRGDAWHRKRDFKRALQDFNQAILLAPKNAAALNERAQVYLDVGELDKAMADYSQAIKLDSQGWRSYSSRGEALRQKGELDRALEDHNAALKMEPSSDDALINRALTWRDKGKVDEALADLDEAIILNPKNARAYGNRSEMRRLNGDMERALADADKAIALVPRSALLHCRRGETLTSLLQLDPALAEFDTARTIAGSAVCAYTGRGQALEAKKDNVGAKAAYSEALAQKAERDPDPAIGKVAQTLARTRIEALQAIETRLAQEMEARRRQENEARLQVASTPPQTSPISDEKRVALVIGNSSYARVGFLPNAKRDAEGVAAAFRKIGFQNVRIATDLTRESFIEALRAFEDDARNADWAVVYYAGHGIEMAGVNYLIPTNARLAADRDVPDEAVSLDRVLGAASPAKKLRVVILDACRENPFVSKMARTSASRSVGRGLARIEPEGGTLVMFAAKEGQIALDGDDGSSPFVSAFLKNVVRPGIEINKVFRYVRDDVLAKTDRRQEPFIYGSLPGDDYFFVMK